MTDKTISPLRQRMIEDMTARRFAEKIQNDYVRYVKNFAAFLGRSPDAATAEDLRLFQLHMAKTHVSPWTINATIVALRFFFRVTLERDDLVRRLTLVREPRRAPIVLSPEEVADFWSGLARQMPDRQIARLLNRAGKPTGRGNERAGFFLSDASRTKLGPLKAQLSNSLWPSR